MHNWPIEPRQLILGITCFAMMGPPVMGCKNSVSNGGDYTLNEHAEACVKACENVARITLEDLDRRVGKSATASKTEVRMSPEKAQEIYSQVKSDCIDMCKEHGTSDQTECFRAAENSREIAACR